MWVFRSILENVYYCRSYWNSKLLISFLFQKVLAKVGNINTCHKFQRFRMSWSANNSWLGPDLSLLKQCQLISAWYDFLIGASHKKWIWIYLVRKRGIFKLLVPHFHFTNFVVYQCHPVVFHRLNHFLVCQTWVQFLRHEWKLKKKDLNGKKKILQATRENMLDFL